MRLTALTTLSSTCLVGITVYHWYKPLIHRVNMPKVKTIDKIAIFEKAAGHKVSFADMQKDKPPIAMGPTSKPIAGNLGSDILPL